MIRCISILTILCLSLIFGMEGISHAGSRMNPALMQEHIEKVKRTKPEKYEAMVQKAGGKITGCRSCHKDVDKKRKK